MQTSNSIGAIATISGFGFTQMLSIDQLQSDINTYLQIVMSLVTTAVGCVTLYGYWKAKRKKPTKKK